MIMQEPPRPTVTLADVLAVLELARTRRDTTAPVPASWDRVIAQMRAVLVVRAAGLPVPGGDPGQQGNTGYS